MQSIKIIMVFHVASGILTAVHPPLSACKLVGHAHPDKLVGHLPHSPGVASGLPTVLQA